MKKTKALCLTLALTLAIAACNVTAALAGVSHKVVCDTSDFSSGINMGSWYTTSNAIVGNSEGIVFGEELARGSRIASKSMLYNPASNPAGEAFSADVALNVKKAVTGRIAVCFGLALPNSEIGSANTTSVYLVTEEDKILLGISAYGADCAERTILDPVDTGAALGGAEIAISLSVSQGGGITVRVNGGDPLCENADADCAASGYLGVGITEKGNSFAITRIRISGYSNYTPENMNVLENFDSDRYNKTVLSTAVENSADQGIVLSSGGALKFDNVSVGYLSTRRVYSNAEISFEIPEIRRAPLYGEDGSVVAPISSGISLSLGCASAGGFYPAKALEFRLVPRGGNNVVPPSSVCLEVYRGSQLADTVVLPAAYNIWSESAVRGRSVGVLVNVTDCRVTFGLRYSDEIGFTPVYESVLDANPDGYIRISAAEAKSDLPAGVDGRFAKKASFSVDNLSVTNTDEDARILVAEYVASFSSVKDYSYTDTWDDGDLLFAD